MWFTSGGFYLFSGVLCEKFISHHSASIISAMLFPELLNREFERQRAGFEAFDLKWRGDVSHYSDELRRITAREAASLRQAAQLSENVALPSDELEHNNGLVCHFGTSWATHEAARRWALEILHDRVTCAADGSQLIPGREVSLPIALVQVAWFENPHCAAGDYHKGAKPVVLAPSDLLGQDDGQLQAETVVSYTRFELEVEALCDFMHRRTGWQERGERLPVAFFDGSLAFMLAFSGSAARKKIQDHYEQAVTRLLTLSQATQIPVVGYIDQSYARDFVKLVDVWQQTGEGAARRYPYDAQLLPHLLKNWGDRTIFCYYRQAGLEKMLGPDGGLGFVYLQASAGGGAARLEFPAWVYRAGLVRELLDVVRAECVCGLGYPYAIETADQAAVITSRDREIFLRAVQEFAHQGGFSFRVARKLASKMRRR